MEPSKAMAHTSAPRGKSRRVKWLAARNPVALPSRWNGLLALLFILSGTAFAQQSLILGKVEPLPSTVAEIYSPADGRVLAAREEPYAVGDAVKKGDPLAVIEHRYNLHDLSHMGTVRWELLSVMLDARRGATKARVDREKAERLFRLGSVSEREVQALRVAEQVAEIGRMGRLKRYFSPQVAETVLKKDDDSLFKTHRREITVVFLDLRGFTAFSDSAEPEEIMDLLRSYHAQMGKLVFKYEGTLERFAGDGIMIFFNDPIACEDHTERAVRMAVAMRAEARELRAGWLKKGYDLDLGVGLACGYATLGNIGFEGRIDYGAIGNVTNLASRLCDEAKGGQILTNQKTLSKVEHLVESEPLTELRLKGFARPVTAINIVGIKE